jgi:hypothetical protein
VEALGGRGKGGLSQFGLTPKSSDLVKSGLFPSSFFPFIIKAFLPRTTTIVKAKRRMNGSIERNKQSSSST